MLSDEKEFFCRENYEYKNCTWFLKLKSASFQFK